MEQIGVIVNSNGSSVKVRCYAKPPGCGGGCAGCKSSCATGIATFIEAENPIDAKIGDKVYVAIEKSSYNKMTYLAYLIPTVFLVIGILLGVYALKNEILAILLGFVLCFSSYVICGKIFKNTSFEYKLTKIIK